MISKYTRYQAQVELTSYLFNYNEDGVFKDTNTLSSLAQKALFADYRHKITTCFSSVVLPTHSWLKDDVYTYPQIEAFKQRLGFLLDNCVINVKIEAGLTTKEKFVQQKNAHSFNLIAPDIFRIGIAPDIVGIDIGDFFMMNSVLYKVTSIDTTNNTVDCSMLQAKFALQNTGMLSDIAIADNYCLTQPGTVNVHDILPRDAGNEIFLIEGDLSVGVFVDIPNHEDLLDIPSNAYPRDETPEIKLAKYNKIVLLSKETKDLLDKTKIACFGDFAGVNQQLYEECKVYLECFDVGLVPMVRMLSNGDGVNNVSSPEVFCVEFLKKINHYRTTKAEIKGKFKTAVYLLNLATTLEAIDKITLQ